MTTRRSVVIGTGSYLPDRVLTNADLAATVDTTDDWIVERTGIRQRHIAAEGELTSDLGVAAARRALAAAGLAAADVAWIVPHQANLRILEGTAKKLELPLTRVIVTVDRHANTSAASVPLALDAAVRDGRIKRGDLLILEAMGGGFTWGAAAVRW
jgi:3-oxoacyl-[acyl-carrier-protein] synthase III